MNNEKFPIAHRKWLDNETSVDEPLYTFPNDKTDIPGHLNMVRYYVGQLTKELPESIREAWLQWAEAAALWHDLGKFSEEFQRHICLSSSSSETVEQHSGKKVDHSTAGAKHASTHWGTSKTPYGDMLAYVIAGHHAGLPNGADLFLERFYKDIPEWESYAPAEVCSFIEPSPPLLWHKKSQASKRNLGFAVAMQIRMLFSFLTDSDFLGTEHFMSQEKRNMRPSWPEDILEQMSHRVETHLSNMENAPDPAPIQHLRHRIHHQCLSQAQVPQGIYQLNVPTGGGKTLSSLSFALAHARHRHMRRVNYVIPFTSIIDQTSRTFRGVMAPLEEQFGMECVLEHHSNLAADKDTERVRLMSENWDAPLIVTTSVQFFESLFSNRPSTCRKLHSIANSVIIFDEAQSLPSHLLAPCLEAMRTLEKDYGCTLVLCTATQPALECKEEFPIGWPAEELTSLLGTDFERQLELSMQRVTIQHLGEMDQNTLMSHWKTLPDKSALFIVNTTKEAQSLFDAFSSQTSTHILHLSARMFPIHRERVIETVKQELEQEKNIILIATRVIEAGIDISFPVVYRACAGIDSIAQAAGRCNRHGERGGKGLVFIYESTDFPIPGILDDLRAAASATREILAQEPDADLLSPEISNLFFRTYYNNRKDQTNLWDSKNIKDMTQLTPVPEKMFKSLKFKDIDKNFKMIPDASRSIMIAIDQEACHIRERLEILDSQGLYPDKNLRREIQRYSVQVYDNEWPVLQDHGIDSYIDDTIHVLQPSQDVYDEHKGILSLRQSDPAYIGFIC